MDDVTSDSPRLASDAGARGIIAGRYAVRARLGRGATKEVYLAYDERLDREVAIAIVVAAATDVARARVIREAQVTGRLGDHPNVITVYDTGEHEGQPYLVLRAMHGGSLAELLARERPALAATIRFGGEIAAALAHAHAHGVVHRDVKPDNVWLTADGSAALGDFGIAHRLDAERLTADGVVVGTVRYLSPEQIRGDEIGPAADLYSLGITLYELVAGRPPFMAADVTQVLTQHLTAAPAPPSEHAPATPRALEELILALLAKDPAARPPSAAAVVAALAAIDAAAPSPPRRADARRLVSVLAARAEVADPEALHVVFDRCAAVIEQHGGTVERYLGDALVGFFGLTGARGDEAVRAVRAAVELRSGTDELRLGIDAGEVFLAAGPRGATVATGAAITAAGRLAERATVGEILLGADARRAVGTDASIDAGSGRLLELHVEQPAVLRTPATPFVGRDAELAELHAALARSRDERTCRLVTVVGPPGIGKSRLAGEFLAAAGAGATVLAGRCPAYGEGTTYRALADIVRGLGDEPRERVEQLLAGDPQSVRGILAAIGQADEPAQAEETALALRRLLERLAREQPLVVAVEDVHWADPALLDLLDHVVALSSGSPILVVCLTRPELLDSRPTWAAPQPNRAVVVLDALADAPARELAERLGAGDRAARIVRRAEGNPLFVEQLVAVDAEQETDELPASIQAVLAARIDGLEDEERTLLQHAAVEGRTFHAGAIAATLPERERRGAARGLVALARKGLIGADRPEHAGEDAFRFTHALIREAAYAGVPKLLRADLHAAVAGWLAERQAADEIIGFHLEQACRFSAELGRASARERALAARAVDRFKAASRAALGRGDPAASGALLRRAIALLDGGGAERLALLPMLGASLYEAGRMTEATRVLDEAIEQASDPRVQARAHVEREFVRLETETSAGTAHARQVADTAMPTLARARDDDGLGRVWSLRALAAWTAGRVREADDAWSQAAGCARRAGDDRALYDALAWRATAAVLGPMPVDAAIELCTEVRAIVAASPVAVAWTMNPLAALHAMRCEFEAAERCLAQANETLTLLGHVDAAVSHHEAYVRLLAGRPDLAEVPLRAGIEKLASVSDGRLLGTTGALLAQALVAQGRRDEAADMCRLAADRAGDDDIVSQVIWRGAKARLLAAAGHGAEAETCAREAVALVRVTDLLSHHGDAMLDLAEVLRTCSRADEARAAVAAALELYEQKGNVAGGARARSLLAV